ncbi:hypothetical protein JCM8547_006195 [Rhodosporidiobolus lusitaniae]
MSVQYTSFTSSPNVAFELLVLLPRPDVLTDLVLLGDGRRSTTFPDPALTISTFVSLRRLTVENARLFYDLFFGLLRRLPLESLTLDPELRLHGPPFSLGEAIHKLVYGPEKLTIKHLTLNLTTGYVGPSAEACGFDLWSFDETWRPVKFPYGFPRAKLEGLIDTARKDGIEVAGTMVEAMKVEDVYVEQRGLIEKYLRESGDPRGKGWLEDLEDNDYAPKKKGKKRRS